MSDQCYVIMGPIVGVAVVAEVVTILIAVLCCVYLKHKSNNDR